MNLPNFLPGSQRRWTRRAAVVALCLGLACLAQRWGGGGGGFVGGGEIRVDEDVKTARDVGTRSVDTPMWTNAPGFDSDVFTFARVRYDKSPTRTWRASGGWTTDLPDADLNLSYRVQQMTSIRVDPKGRLIRLTDKELSDYPFLFLSAPGSLYLTDEESDALRQHLLKGGFLLMDDFHGEREWGNCEQMMAQVFPERKFFELPLDHALYHGIYEIKEKIQICNVGLGKRHEMGSEITWEREDGKVPHHRGIQDDKGRLMVLALHNMDTADGWEREGESDYYFHNFSEKAAYPLGINIIYYIMTH